MAVRYDLKPGQIVDCDFTYGFVPPEIVKVRPVVVLTPSSAGLVTVVVLSKTQPDPKTSVHCVIPRFSMPNIGRFRNKTSWVKGDMIYRVSHFNNI